MDWIIKEEGFAKESIATYGSKFLIGNGYMGIRGTLSEYEKDSLPAINLAGIYDKVGQGWREPLNAPNGCYGYLRVDGEIYKLPETKALEHEISLDYRYGIFSRKTSWKTNRGIVSFCEERFASMSDAHFIGIRYKVQADFHADVEVVTGIDGDVWELNGPHYDHLDMKDEENILLTKGITHENQVAICVAETVSMKFPREIKTIYRDKKVLHRIFFVTESRTEYQIEKFVSIYTDKDGKSPLEQAQSAVKQYAQNGYSKAEKAHKEKWKALWDDSQVLIEGDDKAMEALNYSLYHLHSIAPRHSLSLSIPARGLSGQTYKGAVFWDTEMFMLDFFLFTDPAVARTLVKYRIDTLAGALEKAKSYGYKGAFYAWESQEGGFDACTDYNVTDVFTGRPMRTYFKDKQIHISAAIVYGMIRYVEITGDDSVLKEGGNEVIQECAAFYYDLLLKPLGKDYYELRDVIGPDEYHERVNNNGYTNRMAKYVLEKAGGKYAEAAKHLYIPESNEKKVIPQFDGYLDLEDASLSEVRSRLLHEKEYWGGAYGVASHTQIIKQADVVTWLNLFHQEFDRETLRANWNYYEPRTEHGSSLSACMYAMLSCRLGLPDPAYPFFIKSATADLAGGGKEWAGLVYIGGTHPAAAGGAYMTAIEGFAGLEFEEGKIKINPNLPKDWNRLVFRVHYQGKRYEVEVTKDSYNVRTL